MATKSSLIYSTTDTDGKLSQKTVVYVKNDAPKAKMRTFTQKLAALSADSYVDTTLVQRTDLNSSSTKPAPFSLATLQDECQNATSVNIGGIDDTINLTIESTSTTADFAGKVRVENPILYFDDTDPHVFVGLFALGTEGQLILAPTINGFEFPAEGVSFDVHIGETTDTAEMDFRITIPKDDAVSVEIL